MAAVQLRLCEATRHRIPAEVAQPRYDRQRCMPGILHLGIGAFHRAHQAVYTDELLNRHGGHWRIRAVSLRSPAVRDALAPQDGLYTLNICAPDGLQQRLIGAVEQVLVAPENPGAVIESIADPRIQVLTLTITEKGYGLDATGGLPDTVRADIAADLASGNPPATALGYLAAGLARRRQAGTAGLTLISCDNLAGNGRKLGAALTGLCRARDAGLADWIAQHCSFPCTMVDRIVPASSLAQLDALENRLGVRDAAAVFAEPWSQWIIERRFAGPVPAWDAVGAEFVDEVAPFEEMKLRLLNASHSILAWIGVLAGLDTVSEAIARPGLAGLIQRYLQQEACPSLRLPAGYPVERYCQTLLQRFANPALPHRSAQIAVDSSLKLMQRLLPVLRWNLEHNGPIECTTLALAAWLRFTGSIDERGRSYRIDDPHSEQIAAAQRESSVTRKLGALRPTVFGDIFEQYPLAAERIRLWSETFDRHGVLGSAESLGAQSA